MRWEGKGGKGGQGQGHDVKGDDVSHEKSACMKNK